MSAQFDFKGKTLDNVRINIQPIGDYFRLYVSVCYRDKDTSLSGQMESNHGTMAAALEKVADFVQIIREEGAL